MWMLQALHPRMASIRTAFTTFFGCRVPILAAPMAGVSGGKLAAAVARAGGLGFIAAGERHSFLLIPVLEG
jgi:NAD(P)H-dependent flavin oxidoreductase YrpB (nitropropane dioxygenase family)